MTARAGASCGLQVPAFNIERLHKHCQRNEATGCLEFIGHKTKTGYGTFKVAGRPFLAHRCAYTHGKGPIPDGMTIDHKCRNRSCCNPDHLEAVSHAANMTRRVEALMEERTGDPHGYACKYGHTQFVIGNHNNRYCVVCSRARSLTRYYDRLEVAAGVPA